MKKSDRYLVEIPGIVIKKLTIEGNTPVVQTFSEIGGVRYDAVTYEAVVAIEGIYQSVVEQLNAFGAAMIDEQKEA